MISVSHRTTSMARSSRLLAVVAMLAPCTGGCGDDETIEYRVAVGSVPEIVVTIDGAELDPSDPYIHAEYADFETAITSSLYRIETWREGSRIEAIDIGFGACSLQCAADGDASCVGQDTILEHVGVDIDDQGHFVGGVLPNPRQWRGGCMECRFVGGGSGMWCT